MRTRCHPGAPRGGGGASARGAPGGWGSWGPRAGLAAAGTDRSRERAPTAPERALLGEGRQPDGRARTERRPDRTVQQTQAAGHSDQEWCTHTRAHMHLCASHGQHPPVHLGHKHNTNNTPAKAHTHHLHNTFITLSARTQYTSSTLTANTRAHRPHRHAKRAVRHSTHAHPRSAGAHHATCTTRGVAHPCASQHSQDHTCADSHNTTRVHTYHKSMQPEPHITRHNVTRTCVMCARAMRSRRVHTRTLPP